MRKLPDIQTIIFIVVIALIVIGVGATSYISYNQDVKQKTAAFADSNNFDQYCENGVYYINKGGEKISCGRAPNCRGVAYETTEDMSWRDKAGCWVEDYYGGSRCAAYCSGNIPLCCYKLEKSKNSEDCNWPERAYCLPSQCEGVGDNCGYSIKVWCKNDNCVDSADEIPYIPLENRLAGINAPAENTPAPTNTPLPRPTNTPVPVATNTPVPVATNTPMPAEVVQPTNTPILVGQTNFPTNVNTVSPTQEEVNYPTITQATKPDDNSKERLVQIESPKEIARKIINPKNISNLDQKTQKPLNMARETFESVETIDSKIESFFNRIWQKIIYSIKRRLQ